MRVDNEINLLFQQAVVANSNKKPLDKRKIFFFIFLLLSIFIFSFSFSILLYKVKSLEKDLVVKEQTVSFDTHISKDEKMVLKNLVKHLSKKEHKHVNKIHAELRARFNYRSYLYLDHRTYIKVTNYLHARLKK